MRKIKLSLIIVLTIFTLGCTNAKENNQRTAEWIKTHKKPIIVTKVSWNAWTNGMRYSLQDADNNFYYTDEINFRLPDVIKRSKANADNP